MDLFGDNTSTVLYFNYMKLTFDGEKKREAILGNQPQLPHRSLLANQ